MYHGRPSGGSMRLSMGGSSFTSASSESSVMTSSPSTSVPALVSSVVSFLLSSFVSVRVPVWGSGTAARLDATCTWTVSVTVSVSVSAFFLSFLGAGSSPSILFFARPSPRLYTQDVNWGLLKNSQADRRTRTSRPVIMTPNRFWLHATTCAPHSPPRPPPKAF